VFRDFGIFGVSFLKGETNPILVVDPYAVLSFAVAGQRFQAVARRNQQIGDCLRGVQRSQAPQGDRRDTAEIFDTLPMEEAFRLLASEAPDHTADGIACYVVRQAYKVAREESASGQHH
jgi:hypothetical protein